MTAMLTVIRGTHELCLAALGVPCHRCHVAAGDPCVTDKHGVHLARMATACHDGLISKAEFISAIPDDFTPTTVVEDPGGVT